MELDVIATPLGDLSIVNILLFIDEPKIFICKDESETYYLAYFIDEQADHDEWFFLQISQTRMQEITSGQISIKNALKNPELGWIWKAELSYESEELSKIEKLDRIHINSQDLPIDDVRIISKESQRSSIAKQIAKIDITQRIQETSIEYIDNSVELPARKTRTLEESLSSKRDVLDLSLKINAKNSSELDLQTLGETLSTLQQLIYSLDESWSGKNKAPERVVKRNALNVTTLFAASFGIRIKSQDYADELGSTKVSDSLGKFIELLSLSKNTEQLESKLKTLKPKAVSLFKDLLKIFNQHQIEPKIEYASPNKTYIETRLNSIQIYRAVETIVQVTESSFVDSEVQGTLVGISLEGHRFELKAENGDLYSGKISRLLEQRSFELPMRVLAQIRTYKTVSSLPGEEKIRYELLKLHQYE